MASPGIVNRPQMLAAALVCLVSFSARASDEESPPASVAAPTERAESDEASAPELDAPADGEEDGFWGYLYAINDWYPIILDKNLEPEVDDKVILLWVTTIACGAMCGPLWIPMLIVGEDPGMDYFAKEALLAILIEWLTYVVGGATTSVGGLGSIIITANLCYFAPVSLINTYDRAVKRQRARTGATLEDDDEVPGETGSNSERSSRAPSAVPVTRVGMAF
jgi:hypothetical protein